MNAKPRSKKFSGYAFVVITIFALILSACGLTGQKPEAVEVTRIVNQVVTATPKPVDLQATAGYEATEIVSAAQTAAAEVPAATVQAAAATEVPVVNPTAVSNVSAGTSSMEVVFTAAESLAYPDLVEPDYGRQPVFPDVAYGNRPALVAYELPFEDGDYFEDAHGDVDLPQYYHRVMTAGTIKIAELGIDCVATKTKGCLAILINHYGDTTMFRNATVDNGFTIAGRIWDMGTPEQVTLAGQALLDHYVGRMTAVTDGANCGTIDACKQVEWHVVVVGNGLPQMHWHGLYTRP